MGSARPRRSSPPSTLSGRSAGRVLCRPSAPPCDVYSLVRSAVDIPLFSPRPADHFPPARVTPFTAVRFYLLREADGGFVPLYRKCTHLGCAVPWEPALGQFVCPCPASAFERDGELINAPAPRPLDRFAVTIVDGVVLVDTGNAIQRDQTSPDDLVYA